MNTDLAGSTASFTARVGMMICCCLLFFVATQARAEAVSYPFTCAGVPAPAPCGITITINGSSGHLTATIATPEGAGSYDGSDDQIVGIINESATVAVGAIRLSAPPREKRRWIICFNSIKMDRLATIFPHTKQYQIVLRLTLPITKARATHSSASAPTTQQGRSSLMFPSRLMVGALGLPWRIRLPLSFQ